MTQSILQARPFELPSDPRITALVMADMQYDFVEAGGFGEVLGNDVSLVCTAITLCAEVPAAARQKKIMVIHAREGYRVDLSDCLPVKLTRGGKTFIDEPEPMECILIRGRVGHDIIPELYPVVDEPMIDKLSKSAFYQTDLYLVLQNHGIKTPIVCDVTTEVYATTIVCEANDCGYECIISEDCAGSYFPELQKHVFEMIKVQGTIFGWVTDSKAIIADLEG